MIPILRPRALRLGGQVAFACAITLAAMASGFAAKAQHAGHAAVSNDGSSLHGGTMPVGDGHMAGHGMMLPPPAGVMGAHMPPPGKTMMMYSSKWMHMEGLRIGTRDVTPEDVVRDVPNVNAPPAQIRMVPLEMNGHIQMLGVTHGISPWLSVTAGTMYVRKEMTALTFQGMMGTTRLGTKTVSTSGFGDTRIGANVRLLKGGGYQWHAGLGVFVPTGSITERIRPLMPNGMRGDVRAMYGLQLGTGTFDLAPTLTFLANQERFNFGVQYRGRIALEDENDEGYRWGDRHALTGWVSYGFNESLSGTLRIEASTQGAIDGRDPLIAGAGRGANPAFYGGEGVEAFVGFNARASIPGFGMARLGAEFGKPLYENLNGPQLKRDWSAQLTASVRF